MSGMTILNLSKAIAEYAHEGQSRKGTGEPYINHVTRVAESVYGWKRKSIAYLHDVVEDTTIDLDTLRQFFDDEITYPVFLLTRMDAEKYSEFIDQIILSKNVDAMTVKVADIEDNLRDLDATEFYSMRKRYMTALLRLQEALER